MASRELVWTLLTRLVLAEVTSYQLTSPDTLNEVIHFVLNFSQRRGPGETGIAQSV